MSDELRAVAARVGTLERQNRLMKYAGLLVLLLVGAAVLMGQAAPKGRVLEADAFVVLDKEGNERARLGADAKGAPQLVMNDGKGNTIDLSCGEIIGMRCTLSLKAGKTTAFLGARSDFTEITGASLALSDSNGKDRISLSSSSLTPGLVLRDSEERERVGLHVIANEPALHFYNNEGKATAQLGVIANYPFLSMLDSQDTVRVALSMTDGPRLSISDEMGETRAILGSTSLETTNTGEITNRAPSSLILFDKEGKVVWAAP